jgi:hypothetical protein
MRALGMFLVLLGFWLVPDADGETLGEVLRVHAVPTVAFNRDDLMQTVTNQYAVGTQKSPFLMAYYADVSPDRLPVSLHVIRFDRQTRLLRRTVPPKFGAVGKPCHRSNLPAYAWERS